MNLYPINLPPRVRNRTSESSWSDVVDVAAYKGVPQYPAEDARSGAVDSK